MDQKIRKFIREKNLINDGDKLVIGVSGGADSMALLHVLMDMQNEYHLNLVVVHVNHGIRREAPQDACYVEQFCNSHQIPFYLYSENIPLLAKQSGKTEEEMGRIYRYQCFRKVVKKECADKIVVAHHENDQAETVLFHMIRGTDLKGLTGMAAAFTGEEGIPIIRPLLCVNRREIEAYLRECGINWREDITNQDNVYARNALRNIVLPAMEQINSRTISHISRLAAQITEYEAYFENQIKEYIEKNVEHTEQHQLKINRKKLLENPPVFVRRVLYHLLSDIGEAKKDLSNEHVEALYCLLSNQSGKTLDLPYGVTATLMYENLILGQSLEKEGNAYRRNDGVIYLDSIVWEQNREYNVHIPGFGMFQFQCVCYDDLQAEDKYFLPGKTGNVKNNYTKYFDCDKIIATLCLRTREQDDYLCINTMGNRKTISRYFKDAKIPVDIRNRIPLLASGHEILYVAGYRRCESYQVTKATKKVLVVIYKGEDDGSY